ncbi:hypothetical protein RND71_036699 [Anisodus tanguticus]|uniref:Uncharacterized protein n=1 Tax=Anisodus tanguticus TaxID=243964 RepID=A0AAE1R1N1_9SOLA|nr:hypothetical protein RND71_036699 [Anisodus tanguticus]
MERHTFVSCVVPKIFCRSHSKWSSGLAQLLRSSEVKAHRRSSEDEERGGEGQRWQRCIVGFSGVVNSPEKMKCEESSGMDFTGATTSIRGGR